MPLTPPTRTWTRSVRIIPGRVALRRKVSLQQLVRTPRAARLDISPKFSRMWPRQPRRPLARFDDPLPPASDRARPTAFAASRPLVPAQELLAPARKRNLSGAFLPWIGQ